MQTKLLYENEGLRTYALIFHKGDEAMGELRRFAKEHSLTAAQFSAIGAFQEAELKYFDWETKEYLSIAVEEQVEVASLTGDVVLGEDGETAIHVHTVLGKRDGSALAGHLGRAVVRPTLEVVLTETPAYLHKRHDSESGLALIRME